MEPLNTYSYVNLKTKCPASHALSQFFFQHTDWDILIFLTCWAATGISRSPGALRVSAGRAHSCLGGPAHWRPIASSPRSRGRIWAWKETSKLSGERAMEGGDGQIPALGCMTEPADPTGLQTWAAPFFSITWEDH